MSKFLEIVRFELLYRLKRPATYVYFGLFLGISFLMSAVPDVTFSDAADQLYKNSPYLVTQVMLVITIFGSVVCAGIMGVPVYRDYDHEFYEIMHSLPVRKASYLWGRFIGSWLVSLIIFSSVGIGMSLGFAMPWIDPANLAPYEASVYVEAYLYFIAPNLFIIGAFFFIIGSYFRSQIAIYTQGVVFLVLYFASGIMLQSATENPLYTLLDPFGAEAIGKQTLYWTTYEKNIMHILPVGLVLKNRLLWISLALALAVIFNWRFSVTRRKSLFSRGKMKHPNHISLDQPGVIPDIIPARFNRKARLSQWWHLSTFYFRDTIRSIPFLVTLICAIGFIAIAQLGGENMYGTPTLPVTYMLMDKLTSGFIIFAIVLLVIYSGELIWKDVSNRFSSILDSSPLSNQQVILSKFTAMIMAELIILAVIMLTGMGIQIIHGFYEFQIPVYLKYLFLNFFPLLFLMTFLTFFIHTLVNNKYLGHALILLFYIAQGFYDRLGFWDRMYHYASYPQRGYSGMNGFQKFAMPAMTMEFYWMTFGVILLSISMLFLKRGTEQSFRMRLRLSRIQWKESNVKYLFFSGLILFVLSGAFVYYNTHVLNTYRSKKEDRMFRAKYERTYERYKNLPQPRIVDVSVAVDIFPDEFGMKARGSYLLVNKTHREIDSVHVRIRPEMKINRIGFDKAAKCVDKAPEYGYYIYKLDTAMEPLDTLKFSFDISWFEKGFSNEGRRTEIVPNGTFFTNDFLPYFGYDEAFVLTDKRERKRAGLPPREFESAELTDSSAYSNTYISMNADKIRYDAVVSTSSDQTALTCGRLVRKWSSGARSYFEYKMDVPIWNFVPFLSARYKVLSDSWKGVNIEIYYHPGHEYNLDRMKNAMKKALAYCTNNFSPFQYGALRIVEFPRYATYAQSFAGIIPYSEGVGFIVDVDDENDLDLPFYVTAHEVAHQWWGHQVTAADVKGKLLLVESLANYTALMIMEKEFGKENIGKFLEHEQRNYLMHRSTEKKSEVPLKEVDDQSYIAYQKGSIALYALRRYIGEDTLNKHLARFLKDYANREDTYPTSENLISYISSAVPDSLHYLIHDLFETITLFGNRVESADYKANPEGGYDVTVKVKSQKFHADGIGKQSEEVPADWIDLGIYTREYKGKDSIGYITKIYMDKNTKTFNVHTNFKPGKVSIDPYHILIDRNLKDNVKALP